MSSCKPLSVQRKYKFSAVGIVNERKHENTSINEQTDRQTDYRRAIQLAVVVNEFIVLIENFMETNVSLHQIQI